MFLPAFVATAFVIAVGCRYDWTYVEDDGEGGSKDAAGGEGGSSDGSSGDTKPIENEASPPPPPPPEGCSPGSPCPAGWWCEFGDGKCGKGVTTGKCQQYGGPCESQTACSCNGTVLDKCVSHKNGFDVDQTWGSCGSGDTFKCGTSPQTFCKRGLQFCHVKSSGVPIGCKTITTCSMGCGCTEPKNATIGGCSCDDKTDPGGVTVLCP